MTEISIQGRAVPLEPRKKSKLKGLTVGDTLMYKFYDGGFRNTPLVFVEPLHGNPTPKVCAITASRMTVLFGKPVVFLLTPLPGYERQRLIEKDVFFVISDKYANLPMLVANECVGRKAPCKRISPAAQYILLYHLEVKSLEGLAARDMESQLPYSYESIALGLRCLEDMGLCRREPDGPKRKVAKFCAKGADLWKMAQKVLESPVEERLYCSNLMSEEHYPESGINALAHYSRLNPDGEKTVVMPSSELRQLKSSGALKNANRYDGEVAIESWRYPAVAPRDEKIEWADRLSLALTLRDDDDPRVEVEVERMINETVWTD